MKVPESLARLTAVELAAVVAKRALSAERVAREHLERIAEREPSVGAWVHLDPDHVLTDRGMANPDVGAGGAGNHCSIGECDP